MELREYVVNYLQNMNGVNGQNTEQDVLDAIDDYEDLTGDYVSQETEDQLVFDANNGLLI